MKLYYTPLKGYVHTVEAVINYAGLRDNVEAVPVRPSEPDGPLPGINPLGSVPTLALDDGQYVGGSLVVYEYLDSLHRRRRLFPAKGPQRWTTLRQAAMADGLYDTVLRLWAESELPQEQRRSGLIERDLAIVTRVLDQMEQDVLSYSRIDIAQMRTVGVLQLIKLQMPTIGGALATSGDPKLDFTQGRPHLTTWFKSMARKKLFRQPLV